MDRQRWQRIEEVFARAVELEGEERRRWIAEQAGDDAELLQQVERLLASDAGSDESIEETVRDAAESLLDRARHSLIGRRLGTWRIKSRLGEGGMSAVYLAVRDDESFHKRVAVKLVKRGMDSVAILRRFELERHILASLDHPNIASLVDAGTTAEGLPYFVMEYVDGVPIDRFADEHRLSVRERTRLFLKVCAAVSYAHRNLVVHRDLKPSNILVTGDGVPKLLDFGIAKLLNPELAAESLDMTHQALRPMTPGYASPEQIIGAPVTTASDIYSLGVLLTELLAGRRPYRITKADAGQVERLVRDTEPDPPSVALSRPRVEEMGEPDTETVARRRRADPETLLKGLRGDLDAVVRRCLRKEPQRRYSSVERLGEDLQRHLDGRPLSVRGNDVAYRARRFFGRHRLPIAAGALAFVLLAGFVVALVIQSVRLERERDTSERERLRAEQVSGFLVDLFQVSDPTNARGATVTARELLDRGSVRIGEELSDQPEVQATLLLTIGQVYQQLGLYDRAAPLFDRALAQRRQIFGSENEAVAEILNRAAILRVQLGRYEDAEPLFREALEIRRSLFGPSDEKISASLNNHALVLHDLGDLAGAEARYREALAMDEVLFGSDHPSTATDSLNLGLLLHDLGRDREAEGMLRRVLEIREREHGPRHVDVADALNYLGMALSGQGKHDDAEALIRRSVSITREVLGAEHPRTARSLHALGDALLARGDAQGIATAEALHREALAIRLERLGDDHPEVVGSLAGVGRALARAGRFDEAEDYMRRAVELSRRTLDGGNLEATPALAGLGSLLLNIGRADDLDEAVGLLAEVEVVYRRYLAEDDPRRQQVEQDLERARARLSTVS